MDSGEKITTTITNLPLPPSLPLLPFFPILFQRNHKVKPLNCTTMPTATPSLDNIFISEKTFLRMSEEQMTLCVYVLENQKNMVTSLAPLIREWNLTVSILSVVDVFCSHTPILVYDSETNAYIYPDIYLASFLITKLAALQEVIMKVESAEGEDEGEDEKNGVEKRPSPPRDNSTRKRGTSGTSGFRMAIEGMKVRREASFRSLEKNFRPSNLDKFWMSHYLKKVDALYRKESPRSQLPQPDFMDEWLARIHDFRLRDGDSKILRKLSSEDTLAFHTEILFSYCVFVVDTGKQHRRC